MFAVSDKVVCVEDSYFDRPDMYSASPVKNQVYVVRQCFWHHTDQWAVLLVGIQGQIHPIRGEWCFAASCFRKLTEVKAENALRAAIDQSLYHP